MLVATHEGLTTFTGTAAGDFGAILAGKDALLIPDNENALLHPALGPGARAAIQDFVASGRGLVVNGHLEGRTAALLNSLFGFVTTESDVSGTPAMPRTPAAARTEYKGGPASLQTPNASGALANGSLPPNARRVYSDGTDSMVAVIPSGRGSITYLGWDWFNSSPPSAGAQDGGWQALLHRAVHRFLRLGKPRLNRRKGTAKVRARVAGPGRLTLRGKGVKRVSKRARRRGKLALPVRPRGRTSRALERTGKARVRIRVKLRPVGGGPITKRSRLRLVKRA